MDDRGIDNVTGSEEFAKRLTGVLNDGALCLMLSIGHQTGLFDTMASLPASTSAQIAKAAGMDERYVREWLAAMGTGRIVDHDPNQLTFALPPERAAWLTTGAGPANMAVPAQYVGLLALVEDKSLIVPPVAACRTPPTRNFKHLWPKTAAPCTTRP